MGELQVANLTQDLVLDSREVAEMVGKEHKNLLSDIRTYVATLTKVSAKVGKLNFQPTDFFIESSYVSSQNKTLPCYLVTKKGCEMVANKMIGEKGIIFTASYVSTFEEMEKKLKELHQPSYMIDDPIERAKRWIQEQEEKQVLEVKTLMLEQQVAEAQPKVTYYDEILNSPDVVTVTQIAKDYGISAIQLNAILREEGIQYKQSGQWLLYAPYQDKGYTKSTTKSYVKTDGSTGTSLLTKWTQKGRLFIHNVLSTRNIEAVMDRVS